MSSIPTSSTGNLCLCTCTFKYHIVGNFWGRNSHKFRSFMAILESFLCEIWGVVSFGMAKTSNSWKFSPQKLYFSPICESFLREKFPAIQYVRAEGSVLQALVTQARPLGLIPGDNQLPLFSPLPSNVCPFMTEAKCFTKCSGTFHDGWLSSLWRMQRAFKSPLLPLKSAECIPNSHHYSNILTIH